MFVAWFTLEWHIVVETWEEDVVVKGTVEWFVPVLPGAGVLSSGDEKQIALLKEHTSCHVFLYLASVIQVNEDNVGSVESDIVLEAVFEVVVLAIVVVETE